METITIDAAPRGVGKQAARAVRREGNVPCVLYGHHVDPVAFQVPELSLHPLIYTTELHVVRVQVEGASWDCVVKDIDFHPVTDRPIHVDFQVLQSGERMTLTVPVRYHGTPAGQKEGGDTQVLAHEVEIRCLPKDIPSYIDVDIEALNIGDAIHIGDLEVPGVEFVAEPGRTIVTVVAPRLAAALEEEEAEVGLELEEGAEVDTAEGDEGTEPTGGAEG